DADLRGMVVLRSLGFQLVPFKLHRFRKQRPGLRQGVGRGQTDQMGEAPCTHHSNLLPFRQHDSLLIPFLVR
ncbi:hypothetical protein, partial [Aeromonas salmonicida]